MSRAPMKYSLYDPEFSLEYTHQDELIIYQDDKEITQIVIPGPIKERQLLDNAISILGKQFTAPNYISITDCAKMLNLNRGSLDWIVINQLILNYHYIAIGAKRFLTDKGVEVLEKKIQERND